MMALFHRFHNFIQVLMRGEDHVCGCTCGRDEVYHVVPYNGALSMAASRESHFLSDVMSQQEMDVITGLLLGLCISFFLLWLDRVWLLGLKYWRGSHSYESFWFRIPKFSNTRDLFRWSHPQHKEDSSGKMVHIKRDMCHNSNESI